MNNYLRDSARTLKAGLENIVSRRHVMQIVFAGQLELSRLDAVKKALIYGKEASVLRKPEPGEEPLFNPDTQQNLIDVFHGIIGVATEAGELLELALRLIKDGPSGVLRAKLIDECGDILWYLALIFRALGVDFEQVAAKNIEKLRVRFPDKFEADLAINKDDARESEVFTA